MSPEPLFLGMEEGVEAAGGHLLLKGGVGGVVEGLHAALGGGGDILLAVVEEEDLVDGGVETGGGVLVDG